MSNIFCALDASFAVNDEGKFYWWGLVKKKKLIIIIIIFDKRFKRKLINPHLK